MIGFRVLPRARKVSAEMVAKCRGIPVANISDSMNRIAAGGTRLRPLNEAGAFAGPALTVKTRPGDNLMFHKALNIAEPGDVVVVDGGGELTNSLMGELMLAYAIKRGVVGLVLNGAVRDLANIRVSQLPVFAAGVTHRGPYKDGPGEVNVPIAIDGMVIEPGDLIVGDADGFLCVPFAEADAILSKARKKNEVEEKMMALIEKGESDRAWVDETLRRLGCEF